MAKEGKKIIYTNIGNPHAVGQKPITYYRQVISLCDLPADCGIANPTISSVFPEDVVVRAIEMREAIGPAGTGAYTNSQVRFLDHSLHTKDSATRRSKLQHFIRGSGNFEMT